MKHPIIAIAAFVLFTSIGVNGAAIHSINQTVSIEADGSASLDLTVSISTSDSLSSIMIPAGFDSVILNSVTLDGEYEQISGSISLDRSNPVYSLRFNEPIIGKHSIIIKANVDNFLDWETAGPEEFETYNWEVVFANTLPIVIQTCTLKVLLPTGWNFHRITGSEPKFKKKEPKPPYVFIMEQGRASLVISKTPLPYMEKLAVEFAFKNTEKSNLLIWLGLTLIILYLYYFRNLVTNNSDNNVSNNDEEKK